MEAAALSTIVGPSRNLLKPVLKTFQVGPNSVLILYQRRELGATRDVLRTEYARAYAVMYAPIGRHEGNMLLLLLWSGRKIYRFYALIF